MATVCTISHSPGRACTISLPTQAGHLPTPQPQATLLPLLNAAERKHTYTQHASACLWSSDRHWQAIPRPDPPGSALHIYPSCSSI